MGKREIHDWMTCFRIQGISIRQKVYQKIDMSFETIERELSKRGRFCFQMSNMGCQNKNLKGFFIDDIILLAVHYI